MRERFGILKLGVFLLALLLCGQSWADTNERKASVKITYADGKVVEHKALAEDETYRLMVEMVQSKEDGTYELWDDEEVHIKFELKGDKVTAVSGERNETMSREEFLKRIAPIEPDTDPEE